MNYECDVSVVIVNYNGEKYLFNLFESIKKLVHDDFSFEVVFVDNCSSDNSIDFIKKNEWGKVINLKIIENKVNQGFAQGNNTGVENANGKYIAFLNNDTAVDSMWLTNLYHCIDLHPKYGMVASKLLFFYDFVKLSFHTTDNILLKKRVLINKKEYVIENKFCKNLLYENQLTCFGNTEIALPLLNEDDQYEFKFFFEKYNPQSDFILFCGKRLQIDKKEIVVFATLEEIIKYKYEIIQNAGSNINENYDGYDIGMGDADGQLYNEEKEINAGCGAAIILRKSDFIETGGFDNRFFMYYEDMDLSFRIRKSGKKIIFCPSSLVRHVHTGSSKEWSPFFAYHVYRNKLLFVYKNISKRVFWKFTIRQFLGGIKHRDLIKIRSTIDALKVLFFSLDVGY